MFIAFAERKPLFGAPMQKHFFVCIFGGGGGQRAHVPNKKVAFLLVKF